MSRPVFRFAPSPNGRLHLGHAYSALLNAELARRMDGRLLVRVEDIDPVRSRPDHVAAILTDLAWLGLAWEEPVRRQSEHLGSYDAAADRLRAAGLLYPCWCTRREIARVVAAREAADGRPWPRDPDGAPLHPRPCRVGAADGSRSPAFRLDMAAARAVVADALHYTALDPDGAERPVAAKPERWGDPVLVRRDVPTSYHLAVVVDDALQGVTHVVRGADLEAATDLHVLLQRLLGLPTPRYRHHALMRDGAGAKLAKSRGSRALAELRQAGVTPADIRGSLGFGP